MEQQPEVHAPQQIEGALPHGSNSSLSRCVYVGNIHPNLTERNVSEVFSITGLVVRCNVIRQINQLPFGFVYYANRLSAGIAIAVLNGRRLFGLLLRVNWSHARANLEEAPTYYIFVGGLSQDITDSLLYAYFSVYDSCLKAMVKRDMMSRSRGYGFVFFLKQEDAFSAVDVLDGTYLGGRRIFCRRARLSAVPIYTARHCDRPQDEGSTSGPPERHGNEGAPENDPPCTSVRVSNLDPSVTVAYLQDLFNSLQAGRIEHVNIAEGHIGFVRYRNLIEAAFATLMGNGKILCNRPIMCSWDATMPAPPGLDAVTPESAQAGARTRARAQRLLDDCINTILPRYERTLSRRWVHPFRVPFRGLY